MDFSFVTTMAEQLTRPKAGDTKPPTLWPSESFAVIIEENKEKVIGKCRRSIFLRYVSDAYHFYTIDTSFPKEEYLKYKSLVETVKKETGPTDRYMLWIWAAGVQAENYLIDQAKNAGIYVAEQVPVYIKDYNISGKEDIEIINRITNKLSIVEIKSIYGYGADMILGTKTQQRNGITGTPKDNNLMQIALYHWWHASADPAYEESRLAYIARDTGVYGEFLVRTAEEENITYIEYKNIVPSVGKWIRVPYTIDNILCGFSYINHCVKNAIVPRRDFQSAWTQTQIAEAYIADTLTKSDKEQYEKVEHRLAYNQWVNNLQSMTDEEIYNTYPQFLGDLPVAVKKVHEKTINKNNEIIIDICNIIRKKANCKTNLKPVTKGDWQCQYCKYQDFCDKYSDEQINEMIKEIK